MSEEVKEKKDDLVGRQIYLKKGSYWKDENTGIELKNMPGSIRWIKDQKVEVPASKPEDRIATVPNGADLTFVKQGLAAGRIAFYKEEAQVTAPKEQIPDTPPKSPEEAESRGRDYYWGGDGQLIHKDVGKTAFDILQQSEPKAIGTITSIPDLNLLNHMLSLEKGGHNLSRKPRAKVVDAIEKRIKAADVSGISITKSEEEQINIPYQQVR